MRRSRLVLAVRLILIPACGFAADTGHECPHDEVEAHVRMEFSEYGPLSTDHEYFAFIYRHEGIIGSAVMRGGGCHAGNCSLDTAVAARRIPRGAKVLGEWHTHPRDGSVMLSAEDVRGARSNAHIRCYAAYYSKPNGEILSWDPHSTSVPTAMALRVRIGNYFSPAPRGVLPRNLPNGGETSSAAAVVAMAATPADSADTRSDMAASR